MNTNQIEIDNLLDDLMQEKIGLEEARIALGKLDVGNPQAEIDVHYTAAKALQRYSVLQQVSRVQQSYLSAQAKNTESKQTTGKWVAMPTVRWAMRIAASLLILATTWMGYQFATTSGSQLYGEIYQDYNVNTDRGMGDPVTHEMVNQFQAGDYAAVIATFNKLDVTNNREKFLTGYAYLQTTNYLSAIALFNQIRDFNRQSGTRLYNDEAEFYSGLAYLKLSQHKKAHSIFSEIRQNPDHTYHDRVKGWTLTRMNWLN